MIVPRTLLFVILESRRTLELVIFELIALALSIRDALMMLALTLTIDKTLLSICDRLMSLILMVELSTLEFSMWDCKVCDSVTVLFVTFVNSIRERLMSDSRISLMLTVEFSMTLPKMSAGFMVKKFMVPVVLPFKTLEWFNVETKIMLPREVLLTIVLFMTEELMALPSSMVEL